MPDFNENWLPTKAAYMGQLLMDTGEDEEYDDLPEERKIVIESTVETMLNHCIGPRFLIAMADIMNFSGSNEPLVLFREMLKSMDGKDLARARCPECGATLRQSANHGSDGQVSLFYECFIDQNHFLSEYIVRKDGTVEWVDGDQLI